MEVNRMDTIDRQAAITALRRKLYLAGNSYGEGHNDGIKDAIRWIQQQPPVTPARDCTGCRFKFLPERTDNDTDVIH